MQSLEVPQHPFQQTWLNLSMFGVGFLVLVAFVIVTTVLVASRQRLVIWQQFKAAMAVLIWIVPATAVVATIAYRSDPHFRSSPAGATANIKLASLVNTVVEAPDVEAPRSRLIVHSVDKDEPKWVGKLQTAGGRELACLSSQRFATLAEAEEQITAEALSLVKAHYRGEYPLDGEWQVPVEIVEHYAVKDLVGEVMEKDFGNGITGKMYRAHLRLDFTPELQTAPHGSWRGQMARHRLVILGSILGLVTLMLGTSAGYFRLDDATAGAYRRRLKLAAAALVTAGSLVAVRVIS